MVLNASVADCLALSRNFWLYLPLKFLVSFLPIFFYHIYNTLKYESSKFNNFQNIKLLREISSNWTNYLLRLNAYKTLESC